MRTFWPEMGQDLSGSLQGAGGIGGLLACYRSTAATESAPAGKLMICHRPPGNPENAQTLTIDENAWPAHQKHGDTLGACDGSVPPGPTNSLQSTAYYYTFDGNGNVSELLQV